MSIKNNDLQWDNHLFSELSELIEKSQQQVVSYANSTLTILFWQVGKRINEDVLNNQRASYGKQIVSLIAIRLEEKYGRNFTEKNIRRMMQFAQEFPDFQIVVPLSRQLSWSQFLGLIPKKELEKKLHQALVEAREQFESRKILGK